jgi:hypothetical protein
LPQGPPPSPPPAFCNGRRNHCRPLSVLQRPPQSPPPASCNGRFLSRLPLCALHCATCNVRRLRYRSRSVTATALTAARSAFNPSELPPLWVPVLQLRPVPVARLLLPILNYRTIALCCYSNCPCALRSSPVLCWCGVPRGPLSFQCPTKALGVWLAVYCEYAIGYKWRTWSVRPACAAGMWLGWPCLTKKL